MNLIKGEFVELLESPLKQKASAFFWIFLMLFSSFTPIAFAQENKDNEFNDSTESMKFNSFSEDTFLEIKFADVKESGSSVCKVSRLSQKEVQDIKDKLISDLNGFRAEDISSGEKPKDQVDELAFNEAVFSTGDTREGVKVSVPTVEVEPEQFTPFTEKRVQGAFAVGVVLEDTLRVGRCTDDLRKQGKCSLEGDKLSLRNSGEGIVKDFLNAKESFFEGVFGDEKTGLSDEEKQRIKEQLEGEQLQGQEKETEIPITSGRRIPGEPIINLIDAQSFSAGMASNCNNSKCAIAIYSLFDKYFNSQYSTVITGSILGPTIYHNVGQKIISYGQQRLGGYWPFGIKNSQFLKNVEAGLFTPGTFLGDARIQSLKSLRQKYPEINKVHFDMVSGKGGDSGYSAIKGGGFEAWFSKAIQEDGLIGSIKSPEVKGALYKYFRQMESYFRTTETLIQRNASKAKLVEEAIKDGRLTGAAGKTALAEAKLSDARALSKIMQDVDNHLDVDLPEYFMRKSEWGFPGYGVKDTTRNSVFDLYEDSSRYDMQFFKPFQDHPEGKWINFSKPGGNTVLETDELGNLILYKMSPSAQPLTTVAKDQIDNVIAESAKVGTRMVQLDNGTFIHLSDDTKKIILENVTGDMKIFEQGWIKAPDPLTPQRLAEQMTEGYTKRRLSFYGPNNMNIAANNLLERGFAARNYTSVLDKLYAQDADLIKNYFSLKGGLKYTVAPVLYWWAKRGAGFEEISAYQLPDSWTEVKFLHKDTPIYGDAFIDFFANEGSDQGDLFIQVFQAFPWAMIYDKLSEAFNPINDTYDYVTGDNRRDIVENIVFYLSGPKECPSCSITLKSPNQEIVSGKYEITSDASSFILEETLKGQEKGQLLIAYAHHTDLDGKTDKSESSPGKIDLEQEIKKKNDCSTKVKNLKIEGTDIPLTFGANIGSSVAGFYGTAETLAYVTFGWPAISGTVILQTLVFPQLQDCVDTEEGYYAHYFTPFTEDKSKVASASEKATEKAANLVDEGKDRITGILRGTDTNSVTEKLIDELGKKIENFTNNAKSNQINQATINLQSKANGSFAAPKIFYFWFQPGAIFTPIGYSTQGQTVLTDKKGNKVELSNEKGELKVNGETIIDSSGADHVRLAAPNLEIPAIEIPNTLNLFKLSGERELIQVTVDGTAKVTDSELLDCVRNAVKDQTGLSMETENTLSKAFGRTEEMSTTLYQKLLFSRSPEKIIAEGVLRKTFDNRNTTVSIISNRDVNISVPNEEGFDAGKLNSISLESGSFIVKPETNELIIYLRHHKEGGVIESQEVSSLNAKLTSMNNPNNNCSEPAIELSVRGREGAQQRDSEDFTKSLQHMGPFQILDTESKTIIFYSERDASGICKEKMKIINKNTGEVYDSEISSIQQTEDGIRIRTADGKEHLLDFSAPNGVPTLTYNGEQETLRSAQGRNGSFYYDPEKGLWYAENAQLLPLLEAFRQQGIEFKGNPDGTASGKAGDNIFLFGQDGAGAPNPLANLPSVPENPLTLMLFLISILFAITLIRKKIQ